MPDRHPRTGLGFDVHTFEPGRSLRLGGVQIPDHDGLAGHSDGDAVCHAIADALLGAAALGDIGQHFPDTDPAFAGIAGTDLLAATSAIVRGAGWHLVNVDATVVAERPAVAPHREGMRAAIAAALGLAVGEVSVKATRPEGLGLSGDGIGCLAVATLA